MIIFDITSSNARKSSFFIFTSNDFFHFFSPFIFSRKTPLLITQKEYMPLNINLISRTSEDLGNAQTNKQMLSVLTIPNSINAKEKCEQQRRIYNYHILEVRVTNSTIFHRWSITLRSVHVVIT